MKVGEVSEEHPRIEELQDELAEVEAEREELQSRIDGALEYGWENGDIKAMHYQLTKEIRK